MHKFRYTKNQGWVGGSPKNAPGHGLGWTLFLGMLAQVLRFISCVEKRNYTWHEFHKPPAAGRWYFTVSSCSEKRFAQWSSTSLIEISGSHLSAQPLSLVPAPFFFSPLNLCWLIAFRACMAVTNCITSGVTSGRRH